MSAVSLGDLARTFLLRRQNAALKADVQRLSTEVVTGLAADVRQKTGGDLSALQAIDGSLTVLAARASANGEAASIASALQTGLARLDSLASDMSMKLLSVGNNAPATTTDQLGEESRKPSARRSRRSTRGWATGPSSQALDRNRRRCSMRTPF